MISINRIRLEFKADHIGSGKSQATFVFIESDWNLK